MSVPGASSPRRLVVSVVSRYRIAGVPLLDANSGFEPASGQPSTSVASTPALRWGLEASVGVIPCTELSKNVPLMMSTCRQISWIRWIQQDMR